MKKIIAIILLSLVSMVSAKDKDSTLLRLWNKLKKEQTQDYGPTAVAGVRGDNVYKQDKAQLKRDLYWEN
jgi:hypothetical protein